jgi:hypothetical protein
MSPSVKDHQSEPEAAPPPVCFPCSACGKNLKARTALVGKKVKCPKCSKSTLVPEPPSDEPLLEVEAEPVATPQRRFWIVALIFLVVFVFSCAIYTNLAFAVTNQANYQYFPPFKKYVNANNNRHLGAEYYNIAKSLAAGEGFSSPFNNEKTGPTAWMPPVLPALLAAIIWVCAGNEDAVMAVVIFLQVYSLIATGLLVLGLIRQTTTRIWALTAAIAFVIAVVCDFHFWFQFTHDCWIVLLALDLVIAGVCWYGPLQGWKSAVGWGLLGGLCAMINPIVALAWGILSIAIMFRQRAWYRFGIAVLVAALTLTPWIVRNYFTFGKLIPVKSNLAYELWQSQCRQKDGLLQNFNGHPYGSAGPERRRYKELGEIKFIDERRDMFWKAVREDPLDFADRVACRFLGATLWYVPFNRSDVTQRPWVVWTNRVLHPLPFLSVLVLGFTVLWRPLHWSQWAVMGVYLIYIFPYIGVSYYERYAMPLLGVKVLLVLWAADRMLALLFRDSTYPSEQGETT